MKIIEALKRQNRTLLEMHLGILFCGILCQIVGALLVKNQLYYAKGLWFGILLAAVSVIHMHRSLDRALEFPQSASKMIIRDYVIRYVFVVIILLIVAATEVMNPLVVFLAYMSLKVTALIQPITHKLCNIIFHETDPEPQPLPDECAGEEVEASSDEKGEEMDETI